MEGIFIMKFYDLIKKNIHDYLKVKPWIIYFLFKAGKLDIRILNKITYENLIFLSKRNLEKYENLMLKIVELQEELIKKRKKEKLKVGFIVTTSSMWGLEGVYRALENNSCYEPYVIVLLRDLETKTEELKEQFQIMKRDAIFYLKKKKIRFYVVKEKKDARWGKKLPDILFVQEPGDEEYLQKKFRMENIPCTCMSIFVPYSFWVMKSIDDTYVSRKYMKKFSKIFAPSKVHMRYFEKNAGIDRKRLFYSGYPKCDVYYEKSGDIEDNPIWKDGGIRKAHIVYAPGYMDPAPRFSTFDLNCKEILNIARETKDTVSWVIRLHPDMALTCIKQGVFADIEEWNAYIGEWENLENAVVSIHGSYADIFKTSDGMIMDSVSFLPSYQYVHKPLLFLTKGTQKMNCLGKMLKKVVYTVSARDTEGIKYFINNVIIEGKDEKIELREKFFNENLDYYNENRQLASDYIVSIIENICQP